MQATKVERSCDSFALLKLFLYFFKIAFVIGKLKSAIDNYEQAEKEVLQFSLD